MKKDYSIKIYKGISGALRVGIVALLVFVQILFLMILSMVVSEYSAFFYVLLEIFSFVVIIFLTNDDKNESYKFAWVCIMLMLPLSGHVLYLLWGNRSGNSLELSSTLKMIRYGQKFAYHDKEAIDSFNELKPELKKMSNYMSSEHFPLYKNNEVKYFGMGEDLFDNMKEDLSKAKKYIMISFFIVAEGQLWDEIHEILLDRINNNVKVMFMYDDFGAAFRTNSQFKENLKKEGFDVEIFNPVHKYTGKLYMNYRSHQKIVVIDGEIGYTGGINIADEYSNYITRFGVWKDSGIRIEGDGVWGMVVTFLQMWDTCRGIRTQDYNEYKSDRDFKENEVFTHWIYDGPANNPENPIETVYRMMIDSSSKYCYITTPYLIIGENMQKCFDAAVKSGVDIKIITPGIADKKVVKLMTNYNYGPLLRSGVRIYEYQPGFIHSKVITNEQSVVVGSINLDYRSFYLHYECGLWVSYDDILKDISYDFNETLNECKEITYEDWKNRPTIMKIIQALVAPFQPMV